MVYRQALYARLGSGNVVDVLRVVRRRCSKVADVRSCRIVLKNRVKVLNHGEVGAAVGAEKRDRV